MLYKDMIQSLEDVPIPPTKVSRSPSRRKRNAADADIVDNNNAESNAPQVDNNEDDDSKMFEVNAGQAGQSNEPEPQSESDVVMEDAIEPPDVASKSPRKKKSTSPRKKGSSPLKKKRRLPRVEEIVSQEKATRNFVAEAFNKQQLEDRDDQEQADAVRGAELKGKTCLLRFS